uniref:forkhead box protein N2-like n=1 Tax=Pristiophorus japonicus TaxID=55135 RepID=UPI00398EC5CB
MDGAWLCAGERQGRSSPAPHGGSQSGQAGGEGPGCPSSVGSKREAREDEELTSLNWLHESKNLLTAMSLGGETPAELRPAQAKENQPPPSPAPPELEAKPRASSKPPYSFNCLIFMAIEGSPAQCLPVKEIYKWILERYPYFKRAPVGWKNSVRHNLSLNRCFKRVEKQGREALGKGSFWCIDAESRPNLLQAIRKRTLCIHSPALGSSATDLQYPSHTQDPAGLIQEQVSEESQEQCAAPTLSRDGTAVTGNEEPTQINSRDPALLPLWGDALLASQAPAASGDHNYSLVRMGKWALWPPAPSARDRLGTVSAKLGRCDNGDDDSEGFLSGGESEMEDSSEDEGAEDSLADSGYVPLSLRDPPAREGSEGGPCHGRWEALSFSDIDEELKEVAGSLLNLAGIRS